MESQRDPLRVFDWNVFHGRDAPPDRTLVTSRSRWWRRTEDNGEYVQVNRGLFAEYSNLIGGADWSVCLLQECPPAWAKPLARRCRANAYRVLTSRNQLGPLRRLAARINPDLIGSNEGGSNLTLVRDPWRCVEHRSLLLNRLPARGLEERRRMGFVRLQSSGSEVCVANLHASAGDEPAAERELVRAAEHAVAWAAEAPLLLAGDFNVRPRSSSLFELLERRFALASPTAPAAIDHILARGLETVSPPAPWPSRCRELEIPHKGARRLLRLSDHAPIEAAFVVPTPAMR